MAITLADLDRRIKNLTLIRELASDPECLALMRELASTTSIEPQATPTTPSRPTNAAESFIRRGTSKGVLKDAVIHFIGSMNGGRFTIYDLEHRMKEDGYVFNASTPSIAINGVVKRLLESGEQIEVETRGAGSSPTYYRRLHAESSA